MKEEAAHSIELIREAQKLAEEAKAEMRCTKRDSIRRKARPRRRPIERPRQNAGRNAQRGYGNSSADKVKAVEAMIDGYIKRAVDEAVRVERAKLEAHAGSNAAAGGGIRGAAAGNAECGWLVIAP